MLWGTEEPSVDVAYWFSTWRHFSFSSFVFCLTLRGIRILFNIDLTVKLVLSLCLTANPTIVLRTRIQKDLRMIRRTVEMSKEKSAWILYKVYFTVRIPSGKVKGLPLRKVFPLYLFKMLISKCVNSAGLGIMVPVLLDFCKRRSISKMRKLTVWGSVSSLISPNLLVRYWTERGGLEKAMSAKLRISVGGMQQGWQGRNILIVEVGCGAERLIN